MDISEPQTEHLENFPEAFYGFIYHYYRAEVYRETNWRNRLDTTTNWSIVVTAAMLSFVFSNPQAPPSIILIDYLLVWFFLYIESRRYRYYSLLRERTRIIEKQLLPQIFLGKAKKLNESRWREKLVKSFIHMKVPMGRLESVAWRLRRNYLIIFPLIFISWLAKIQSFPVPAQTPDRFFLNARVWLIPGEIVFYFFMISVIIAVILSFYLPIKSKHSDLP